MLCAPDSALLHRAASAVFAVLWWVETLSLIHGNVACAGQFTAEACYTFWHRSGLLVSELVAPWCADAAFDAWLLWPAVLLVGAPGFGFRMHCPFF